MSNKIPVDDRAAKKRLTAAVAAFQALEPAERRALFTKFGECRCAKLNEAMVQNPAAAIGGVFGAVLAESLFPSKNAVTKVKDVLSGTFDARDLGVPPGSGDLAGVTPKKDGDE